ncbi:PcfJ-like protein [Mucilaginibacter lappiensis]|uniref:DNA-directed RNA polymerase subunit RPC12/RpoP n=1 Tax=Mucilaginibacter lappiensis TaxID=354630 RepID=A0ABR6PJG4_9SPHI|nr:PcfJ domain-containing protein [Mucilaginibacter lappiensis]MBB6109753.1 DNA-directed RNA polymerase subunit RPC12/RpoP [Mucilaginibacter lappiensis]SIR14347.1 PcfJ-like protein [Mucilaginibacter lappiensis]
MRPRTKLHHAILALSNSLPEVTKHQRAYAFKHCLQHIGYRNKKGISCLDCGHTWAGPKVGNKITCPSCKTKLTIEDTLKRKFDQVRKYMSVLDVRIDYQVVRIFELSSYHKVGETPLQYFREVVQQFFQVDGNMHVVARNRGHMGNYDNFHGDLEIRGTDGWHGNKFDLWTDKTYPKFKVLPVFARNGYTYPVHEVSSYKILKGILRSAKSETLIKAGQIGLLEACVSNRENDIYRYWNSIKIAIRNNIIIQPENVITWLDYLALLQYFDKDLNSPRYLFPADLKSAHDQLVVKKQKVQKLREAERRRREAIEMQEAYESAKKAFFGLAFTNGTITIKVLESVPEFAEEGLKLHHCIFTNEYFKKEKSLILSARIDGKPVETIEVALDEMKIKQSRGLQNLPTPHHNDILKLVRKNLPVIRKVYRETKSVAA